MIIQIILILIFTFIAVVIDLKTGYIPNFITGIMAVVGIIINIMLNGTVLWFIVISSIILYVFGIYISKKGMGGGDIKLYIGINCLLPFYHNYIFILYVVLLSNILGFIYMKLIKIKVVRFAPFILVALILLFFIL